MGTHECQRHPSETAGEAMDFMEIARREVAQPNCHQDFILNMDQTPIPFTFNSKRTLEVVGKKSVLTRKSTSDTKRVTCAATITASRKSLTPMLIFKGKPMGRIVRTEFPTYPQGVVYACQDNAWMDEHCMMEWVEKVLQPYVLDAPDHIVPVLYLNSYCCHMMASVVESIQELGVEVKHIPGGCTSLCQPVDIGYNKPLKSRMRESWEAWMIAEGLLNNKTAPPTRELICDWLLQSVNAIPEQFIFNAWRHVNYIWFPAICAPPPQPTVGV